MRRGWTVAFLVVFGISLVWSTPQNDKPPAFSPKDRELIGTYYKHLLGTLAPGSLDRSAFPLGIEQALVAGSHVPLQLEKNLELLPQKLESELSQLSGEYSRYKLGRHVLLVRKGDLAIADIVKNAGTK